MSNKDGVHDPFHIALHEEVLRQHALIENAMEVASCAYKKARRYKQDNYTRICGGNKTINDRGYSASIEYITSENKVA